jgi:hypothetical protein
MDGSPKNEYEKIYANARSIEEAEKDKMRNKCQKIIDHGINCFINRQLIYNFLGYKSRVHIENE